MTRLPRCTSCAQVEDEDDAMAVAIAASMREAAKADTELAEINQVNCLQGG